jgi:hypothetical protein
MRMNRKSLALAMKLKVRWQYSATLELVEIKQGRAVEK